MGQIAEALRKAERERLTRTGGGAATIAPPRPRRERGGAADEAPETCAPATIIEGMSESLVAYYERSSAVGEQYRSLRTRLLSERRHDEHRMLAVTSSAPKEGKTITTVNLAFALAEVQHLNTLVVDADFRRSALARVLNLRPSPGLAELLTGEVKYPEVIQNTPVPNLHFVAAGKANGRSAPQLLSAVRAGSVFRWFESQYGFTIVDTPPATAVTDVGIVGQFCSGVIMVIRMHQTPEPLVKRAVRFLQVNNIPIVGCVLIGRDEPNAGYGCRYNVCD